MVEFLEETCRTKGASPAVDAADGSLAFDELRRSALRVGSFIAKTRGKQCEKAMVAVYLPKGARCLCVMLGVLYSGNVYVPMDCRAPINRTKLILEIVRPVLIITDAKSRQMLIDAGISDGIIADYDEAAAATAPDADGFIRLTLSRTQDTDPAYLLFTSGSTGVPKGVVIPHRRIINYINWARQYFAITGGEVIGNQAPFYFTVSAMDIYLSIAAGAKLCLIPENLFSQPAKLLRYLDEEKITLIFWVSSVYHHIAKADMLREIKPKSLRRAWFVGEPMAVPSLAHWLEQLPGVEFANLYGSTETDMTICYTIRKDYAPGDAVPLGYPCANTEILLLRDDLTPAADGELGEICVRGSCLALGYYRDIPKTQASFIQNPLNGDYPDIIYKTGDLGEIRDGLVVFHGRKDHQFKHLGYRIEAGEIEAIAAKFEGVQNACVLYDDKRRQIVLFYEAHGAVDELACRRALMADLPVYMVPTRFVKLDNMPFNANKKKDRILLKQKFIESGETV